MRYLKCTHCGKTRLASDSDFLGCRTKVFDTLIVSVVCDECQKQILNFGRKNFYKKEISQIELKNELDF